MYMHVCVLVHIGKHASEARGWCWALSSIALHIMFGDKDFLFNLEWASESLHSLPPVLRLQIYLSTAFF